MRLEWLEGVLFAPLSVSERGWGRGQKLSKTSVHLPYSTVTDFAKFLG